MRRFLLPLALLLACSDDDTCVEPSLCEYAREIVVCAVEQYCPLDASADELEACAEQCADELTCDPMIPTEWTSARIIAIEWLQGVRDTSCS